MKIISITCCMLILIACQRDQKKAAKYEKFADAYSDYLKAMAADSVGTDSTSTILDSVLQKNDIGKNEFFQKMDYLQKHPNEMEAVLKDVIDRLEKSRPPSQ